MPESNWKYAQNQFLRVTASRRPLMLAISADHTAKLPAKLGSLPDADIQACVILEPGQRQQVQWPSVTIDSEVDEVVLRDADNNIVARGERDETPPDPGV